MLRADAFDASQHYHPLYRFHTAPHISTPPTRSSMHAPMRIYEPVMMPHRQGFIEQAYKDYHHAAHPPSFHSTVSLGQYQPPPVAPISLAYPPLPSTYRPAQGILSVNQLLSLAYTPASSNATTPSSYEEETPLTATPTRDFDETAIRQFAWPIDGRIQAEREEQQWRPRSSTFSPQPMSTISAYWPDTYTFGVDDNVADSMTSPLSAYTEHVYTPHVVTPPTPMRSITHTASQAEINNVGASRERSPPAFCSLPQQKSRLPEVGLPHAESDDGSDADTVLSLLSKGDLLQRTISAKLAESSQEQVYHFAKAKRDYEQETNRKTKPRRNTRRTSTSASEVVLTSENAQTNATSVTHRVCTKKRVRNDRRPAAVLQTGERLCEMCKARAVLPRYGAERFCGPKCARTYSIEIRHTRNKRQKQEETSAKEDH